MGMRRPSAEGPVDGGMGQRHVERHAIVLGGQRLQVGADLVRDIAIRSHAVGADDAEIHEVLLHQMAAGIVGDDGVRHAVAAELEGREEAP